MTTETLPTWTVGERMAKARETAGISRHEMAAKLRVSERTIRNYEGGATRVTRGVVIAYATFTGVPDWWIESDQPGELDDRVRSGCFPPAVLTEYEQLSLSVAAA